MTRPNERGLGPDVQFCAHHDRNTPDEPCTCKPQEDLHQYSETCFCATCTAFRQIADADFEKLVNELCQQDGAA